MHPHELMGIRGNINPRLETETRGVDWLFKIDTPTESDRIVRSAPFNRPCPDFWEPSTRGSPYGSARGGIPRCIVPLRTRSVGSMIGSERFATPVPIRGRLAEYERHQPGKTLLYEVVRDQLETFLAKSRECGRPAPRFVEQELRAFLRCGILANGFLRLHCDDCGFDRLVPFSCKRRGFCPSPAAAAAWRKRRHTSSIACCPKSRSASGCSRCRTRFVIAVPTTRDSRAKYSAPSCAPSSPNSGGALDNTGELRAPQCGAVSIRPEIRLRTESQPPLPHSRTRWCLRPKSMSPGRRLGSRPCRRPITTKWRGCSQAPRVACNGSWRNARAKTKTPSPGMSRCSPCSRRLHCELAVQVDPMRASAGGDSATASNR